MGRLCQHSTSECLVLRPEEHGTMKLNKLLFGNDYPFATVDASIEGLRRLNNQLDGTMLPRLNADEMETLSHRDSLSILDLMETT